MAMTFDERQRCARLIDEAKKQYPDLFRVPDVPPSPEEFKRQYGQMFDQDVLAQFKTAGTFRAGGKTWPRPTQVIIDDIYPQGRTYETFYICYD